MKTTYLLPLLSSFSLSLAALFTSCDSGSFKVSGEIGGADGKTVVVERPDYHGRWVAMDSTSISGSGSFSLKISAPEHPEIYRLKLGDSYLYFPVEKSENIEVATTAQDFGKVYELSGSPKAEIMARIDKEAIALPGVADADSVDRFKKKVFAEVFAPGKGDILSYYFLTKTIDGQLLFDPNDSQDAKYYAAVATAFQQFNPEDPHAALLEAVGMQAMRNRQASKGTGKTMQANEIQYFDMSLPDYAGTQKSLSQLAENGRPTILVFYALTVPEAPELNKQLLEIYNRGGVDIYQVCIDQDIHQWSEAAKNLPWTVVYDQNGAESMNLANYNVYEIPTFFVLDSNGSISSRASSISELKKQL